MHLFTVSIVTLALFYFTVALCFAFSIITLPYNAILWNPPHTIDKGSLELLDPNTLFWTQATDTTANDEATRRGCS